MFTQRVHPPQRVIHAVEVRHQAQGIGDLALDGVDSNKPLVVRAVEPCLGIVHAQDIVPVVAGVAQLGPDAAVAAGDGQGFPVGDLAPLVVIRTTDNTAKLVGKVGGAAQPVLMGVVLQDVGGDVLAPPVGALAGDLHAQAFQTVDPLIVEAALFLHDQGLEGGGGVVNDVAFFHHLELILNSIIVDVVHQIKEIR